MNLPDGTNPYGRMLSLMREASAKDAATGLVLGEYLGNKKFLLGDHTFEDGEYMIVQNTINIGGKSFKVPGLEAQQNEIASVPQLAKGDAVVAYQFDDAEFVILGKVVS